MALEFSVVHRVQFSETDQAGVVHFANYFRWMEEVEHAFFRSLGLSVNTIHEAAQLGWPRVATSCEYFGPAKFEDEVTLRMKVVKVGQKSFNYEVEFWIGDRRIALGKMTSVCCAMTPPTGGGFVATPIPEPIRAKLSG